MPENKTMKSAVLFWLNLCTIRKHFMNRVPPLSNDGWVHGSFLMLFHSHTSLKDWDSATSLFVSTVYFHLILSLMHHLVAPEWKVEGGGSDCGFRNQECRLKVISCDHIVMSQDHELLPGIAAHLWCSKVREREVTMYFMRTARWPQCWEWNGHMMLSRARFTPSSQYSSSG